METVKAGWVSPRAIAETKRNEIIVCICAKDAPLLDVRVVSLSPVDLDCFFSMSLSCLVSHGSCHRVWCQGWWPCDTVTDPLATTAILLPCAPCVCVCVCALALERPEEGDGPPGTGDTDDRETPYGCWEWNLCLNHSPRNT